MFWLSLTCPIVLELLRPCLVNDTVQHYVSRHLPFQAPGLLGVLETAFGCLAVRKDWHVPGYEQQEIQEWLINHPEDYKVLVSSLLSEGVRWFLWGSVAAIAEAFYFLGDADALPVSRSEVRPDHEWLCTDLHYRDLVSVMASGGADQCPRLCSMILSCVFHLELLLPAEAGLGECTEVEVVPGGGEQGIIAGKKQQQPQQQGRPMLSRSSTDSHSSCSRSSSSSWVIRSSLRDEAGELEGCNESCRHEAEGPGTQSGTHLQDAGVEYDGRICMQELSAAAAVAGSYSPSEGKGTPCNPDTVHWFFISLPDTTSALSTAGAAAAAAATVHGNPEQFSAPPSLSQLRVLLELAVLLSACKGCESVSWGCVLLLVALLQQSSVEVRNQLMQQRGSLMLQLLYHVLRQDSGLGGQGFDARDYARFGVLVSKAGEAVQRGVVKYEERSVREPRSAEEVMEMLLQEESALGLHEVVLMALQCLVYDHVGLPPGPQEHLGTFMTLARGEGRCFWSFAVCREVVV
jgi:hypothetical protein